MRKLWLPLLMLFAISAYAEKPTAPSMISGAENLSAEQVIELILNTPDLVIIDARKSDEYAKGHIENAINLLNTELTEEILSIHVSDKTTPLLFYCNGVRCLRSTSAAKRPSPGAIATSTGSVEAGLSGVRKIYLLANNSDTLKRPSLRSSTIISVTLIGLLFILLSSLAGNYFREAALDAQTKSLSRIIEIASHEILRKLQQHALNLSTSINAQNNLGRPCTLGRRINERRRSLRSWMTRLSPDLWGLMMLSW